MTRLPSASILSNALATSTQIIEFQKYWTGSPDPAVFKISLLTQSAGVLLRLPQTVIAAAIVLLQRYLISVPFNIQNSDLSFSSETNPDSSLALASAASVFISAKQSFYPLSPRSIINVFALLLSTQNSPLSFIKTKSAPATEPIDSTKHHVSEGVYLARRLSLFDEEFKILSSVGFDTKVTLPHSLALTYLSTLNAATPVLSRLVLANLNAALVSPQLLYLTHQPNALAVAAIYISARVNGVALVDDEVAWWEVFDVSREELGFLVLSMSSLNEFFDSQLT